MGDSHRKDAAAEIWLAIVVLHFAGCLILIPFEWHFWKKKNKYFYVLSSTEIKGSTPLDPQPRNAPQESQGSLLVLGWVVLSAGSVTSKAGFAQHGNSLVAVEHGVVHGGIHIP